MGKIEVSQARIDANRANSKRSSGPKTCSGKLRSRRNSLIHGLAGRGSVMPEVEEQAVRARAALYNETLRPFDDFDQELVHIIATETVRVERIRKEERAVRDQLSRRAEANWDEDRRIEVEILARRMKKHPAEVALKLSTTSAGCDWLIGRWEWLLGKLDDGEAWTKADRSLAQDLLGIEPSFRRKRKGAKPPEGDDLAAHRREVAEAEIERLKIRKYERLDDLDAEQRDCMIHGLDIRGIPELNRFRRYENASLRKIEWALRVLELRTGRSRVLHGLGGDGGGGGTSRSKFNIMRTPAGYDDSNDHYAAPPGTPGGAHFSAAPDRPTARTVLADVAAVVADAPSLAGLAAARVDRGAGAWRPKAAAPAVLSGFSDPQPLSAGLEFLYPLTPEQAERELYVSRSDRDAESRLFAPLSERFTMSDKTARRERDRRRRVVAKARSLEGQARR